MKVTCALSQSQIEKLYANVYGHMLNQGEAFDPKQYMTDLFNKIAKKKDVDTAAKFLQQVPSLIGIASFRPSLEEFDIPTDMLKPLIKQFKKNDNGLINTVNYFNPTLNPEVRKEIVQAKADAAFDVKEEDTTTVPVDPFNYQPYSSLSTTFQEFISLDPNKDISLETLDPGKRTIYTTLNAIRDNANNNTPLKELIYQDTILKLKPVRLSDVDPETLDKTTKRLMNRAGFLIGAGKAQANVTTPDKIFLMVITDNEGNQLFFDEKGNITTKELGGTLVYQFLREVRKEGSDYRVTDIYGKRDQIMDPAIIAERTGITVEEAKARQQKEFEELYNFRNKLIKGEIDPLIDIVGVSTGISDNKPEKMNLSNVTLTLEDNDDAIRTLDTVKSSRAGIKKGEAVITIKGVEYKVDRPNLTSDIATKIAAVLTSKTLTNKEKYKFVNQFLADSASNATRKHSLEYLPKTKQLIYKYSPTTFQEGYQDMVTVNLDAPQAAEEIYKSLMQASGKAGRYFPAKMTFNKEALDRNGYQDFNMETRELQEDFSNYIELLKGLPNTKIFVDVTPSSRSFNSYMGFALPNEFTEQLAKAQENNDVVVKDDFFETLTDNENKAPTFGVKETRDKLISILSSGKEVKGTISKPFGAITKWHLTTGKGNIIEFYDKNNSITIDDFTETATLNLVPEAEFNGQLFTNVIEVKIGDRVVGYVRETENFAATKQQAPTKSIEEIEAEINEVTDGKGEAKPEDGGVADIFFFRKGDLPAGVTEKQIKDAKKWWANSPLNAHIGFREVANIVNSDAFARFTAYGATLNGNLGIIDLAAKGSMVDVYHEAWHGFSQLYLSRDEKKALYKEVQKRMGTKADFFEIEEELAEGFREYARTGKALKGAPKTNNIFKKILNFLRALFGKGAITNVNDISSVNELFEKLYLGKDLNKYTPSIDNVMFDVLNRNIGIVKVGTTDQQALNRQDSNLLSTSIDSIISDIIDEQVQAKGMKSATLSILLDSRNREPLYKLVKVKLEAKLKTYQEQLEATEDTAENEFKRQILENRIRIIQAGIDNYGDTKTGLIGYHVENSAYDLMKQKYTALELDEEGNLFDPQNAENTERYGDKKIGDKSLIELAGKETLYILKSLHDSTIDEKTNTLKYQYNELGFKKLADFRSTWNNTVREIGGVQDAQEMYNRLLKAGEKNPQLRQLVETKIANPETSTNLYEFQATTSIWQDFSKSKVPYIQFTIFRTDITEEGDIDKTYDYKSSAVTEASNETLNIIAKFENNFKASTSNPYVDRVGKENTPMLNLQRVVKDFGVNGALNTNKSFEFARAIGLQLDDLSIIKNTLKKDNKTIEQFGLPYIYDIIKKLSDKEGGVNKSTVNTLILRFKMEPIRTMMTKNIGEIPGIKSLNQKNKIIAIAGLQARYGLGASNNMVLNAEKNLVSEFIENNTISKQVYALNNAKKLSDLWTSDEFQYMSYMDPRVNPYTKRLATIRSLFELNGAQQNRRADRSLLLFMDSGTQVEDVTGLNTTSLDVNSKMLQEMNTLLKDGIQEFMRHASKSSSFGARIEGGIVGLPGKEGIDNNLWVDIDMFINNTAYDYAFKAHMLPYMEAEAERIYRFKLNKEEFSNYAGYNRDIGNGVLAGEVFTAFDNVLTGSSKNKIYAAIDKAIAENKVFDLREFLKNDTTGLLNTVRNNVRMYFEQQTTINEIPLIASSYLDSDLTDRVDASGVSGKRKLVEAYTYNSWIHNFEMATLFYGDISQYNHEKEELHKRNTGSTSGGRGYRTDIAARNFANDFLAKTSYAKKAGLAPIVYNGTFNTGILQDVKRDSVYLSQIEEGLRKDYAERYEKAGVKNAKAEIDRRIKVELSKYKGMEEGDGQGFISFDAYRTLKYLENSWSNDQEILFQKIKNGEEVKASDVTELFPVYKLQHFGHLANTGLPVNAMHKFALAPLIPSVIDGSDLQSLHEQMMAKNIQYVTFQSGSKVGSVTSNGKADAIYEKDNDQKVLKKDIAFTPNTIYLENLKNVTNVPSKFKNKTVFSTQLRKLILGNMYSDGKIINPANEESVKRYEKAVDNYTNILKLELLQDIGYEYNEDTKKYTGNFQDFLDVVQRELDRRDLPEHLIQLVGLNRDNTLKTDLSIHLVADEIEAILVALVEKRLVKQKVKGEALVQVASSMSNGLWDSNLKKGTEAEIRKFMGTNNLPFYNRDTIDGKTNAMKVAIALQGDFVNLLKLKALDGKPIATRARLNEMIKNDEWLNIGNNRKAVTLSAVRIPVQGLNSMEFMEVYEFLDPTAGNIIIPPTEIVAKSGADFDVDKLTTFMPAIDSKGQFVETGLSNNQVLAKVKAESDSKLAAGLIKNQKAALENELITSIRGILELNDNYATLVKPNDTYLLKDDIADKIQDNVVDYNRFENMHGEPVRVGKKGTKVISPTRTLEVSYNLHKHEVNMVGKRVLGMIAVENSLHPVMNSIGASLPKTYKNLNYSNSLGKNIEGTINYNVRLFLPHNKTEDGRVSLSGVNTADGLDNIGELYSQMMNGAVDVEKDPWIFFMQGNYEITPMITFLLKAGVPREHAIYFVSNPIVREYARQQRSLKSAYARVTGRIEENFPSTRIKYQAAVNALEKFGDLGGRYKVSGKKYYDAVSNAINKPGVLNVDSEFDINDMKNIVRNPNSPELKDKAIAMFLHFIELEKSSRGFTSLKFLSNPDTKTSKTLQEIIRRNLNIEDAKALSSLEKGTVEAMQDSILGSFFDNKLIGDLIIPVFPLRNNDIVTSYILRKAQNNSEKIVEAFGPGQDGTRSFITSFKNAIPTYIYQNYMSNFIDENGNITSMPKEYKEMPVVNKAGVKNGAAVIDGTLYVDKARLEKEFKGQLYSKLSTEPGNYASNNLRGFGSINNLFPNESMYFKYVFERELQRSLYPMESLETNKDYLRLKELIKDGKQAYEAYLNQRALINAFNRKALMDFDGQSYTDLLLNTIEDYPQLANRYSIIKQLTKPVIKTGEEVISLNDVSALKDPQIAEIYYQNLTDLADENVKKVSNPEDNRRISKLFSMLPLVAIYQHGIGYSKYGFNKALPYNDFVGVMQTASEIFMKKQLNDETLDVIFKRLIDTKNKNFKDYVVSPKEYIAPTPIASVEGTISEEAADALLKRMGVESIEEADINASTQLSTSVKPTIDLSKEWFGDLKTRPVYTSEGVNTMRTEVANKDEHFGNPFSESGVNGTIKVDSIDKAVRAYKDWLLDDATTKDYGIDPKEFLKAIIISNGGKPTSKGMFAIDGQHYYVPNINIMEKPYGYDAFINVSNDEIYLGSSNNGYKDFVSEPYYPLSDLKFEQREWILDQINNGNLDGATLLYAGKLESRGQGMHPTALAEVVEQLRSKPIQSSTADANLPGPETNINIYAGTGENAELSNFALRPFTVNVETSSGEKTFTFQSVEQGFHFYKTVVANRPDIGKKILATTNGGVLKSLTNSRNLQLTPEQIKEWDSTSKSVMLNLMYDSFMQNPEAAKKLLATGNAVLTHKVNNIEQDKGRFSEVITTVRDMLRETVQPTANSKTVQAYRTLNTFSSKVDYAQRGSGVYYALDKPFQELGANDEVEEVTVSYDPSKTLDATTEEGQARFMEIKRSAIEGKSFKSMKESNDAVSAAMLENGYESLIGFIEQDMPVEGGKELVLYKPTAQPSAKVVEVIPTYGAVQVSTNPTKEFDTYLTDVISDNIKNNAYVENGSSSANLMFSYGWQWKGNNSKQVIGDKLIVQPAQVDFTGKGTPVAVKTKYFYDSKYNDGAPVPPISELNFLKKHIENNLGIDMSDYDVALNNIYTKGTNLYRHTDIDESNTAKNYPVVVYVLGNEHKVRIDDNGGAAVRGMGEMVNPKTLTLKNGDIYTFGMNGKGRFEAVHDVIRTDKTDNSFPPITLPDGRIIKNYTVTFTFRRAADLEAGMPIAPAKLNTQPSSDMPITGRITDTNAPEGLPGIPRTSTDCQ